MSRSFGCRALCKALASAEHGGSFGFSFVGGTETSKGLEAGSTMERPVCLSDYSPK